MIEHAVSETGTAGKRHRITIAGSECQFDCAPEDTLLRGALRAGCGMAYECNSGACGSCKVTLVRGELHDLYPAAPGIGARDRNRSRWLACQSIPHSDCTITARIANEYVPSDRPRRMPAYLTAVRDITHDIREFTFRTPNPASFRAGQYALVALREGSTPRAYSMSNITNGTGEWQFMVRRKPGGAVSGRIFELALGSSVQIDGAFGWPICGKTVRATSFASPEDPASHRWYRS